MRRRQFIAAATGAAVAGGVARAQSDAKYRACIIGDSSSGDYGHSFHLAFDRRSDVEVVAVADPDTAEARAHADAAGARRTYRDYREMLAVEKPDMVAIGPRTTNRRREHLVACAEAGAHGFIEKPLSIDMADADAMLDAVRANNVKWAIAYNFRHTPTLAHLKQAIHDGLIGDVIEVRGRGKEDDRAGGEDLIVLGTHVFDTMRYIFGEPSACTARVLRDGRPAAPGDVHEATEPLGPIVGDSIHAMYEFPGGVIATFDTHASVQGAGGRWGVQFCGGKGVIDLRYEVEPEVRWLDDPRWLGAAADWRPLPDAPEFRIDDQSRDRHRYIVDDLIAAIEEDRRPAVDIADGAKAQEMILAAWASHVEGGPVALPLADREHPLARWAG